ncbi:MAG: hypothetical protein ACLRTQ_05875 [Candidatus Borkfalkia sp.]
MPDAIPPVKEGAAFTVNANESAGFVLRAKTSADTPAGEYTATLEVFDGAGRQIKTAKVFLHVWISSIGRHRLPHGNVDRQKYFDGARL